MAIQSNSKQAPPARVASSLPCAQPRRNFKRELEAYLEMTSPHDPIIGQLALALERHLSQARPDFARVELESL